LDYDGHGSGRQDRILGHNHDYYLEVRKTMMMGRRRVFGCSNLDIFGIKF
jgi:hypothetical protein